MQDNPETGFLRLPQVLSIIPLGKTSSSDPAVDDEKAMTNIVIGGAIRSGTTLLNSVLCHIPHSNPHLQECKVLLGLITEYIKELERFEANNCQYFRGKADFKTFYASMVKVIFANVRQIYNCQNVVIKHPELAQVFSELDDFLDGKVIFFVMVRNPLDTIASMVTISDNLHQKGLNHDILSKRDIPAYVRKYAMYYNRLLSTFNGDNLNFVKYEDLVTHPYDVVKQLELATKSDLSSWKADRVWGKVESGPNIHPVQTARRAAFRTELYGKPLSQDSLGRYKKVLNTDEITFINNACKDFMKRFGYLQPGQSSQAQDDEDE